jgi:hypothetical protein
MCARFLPRLYVTRLHGAYSNPGLRARLRRLSEKLDGLAASDAPRSPSHRQDRRLRNGLLADAIGRILIEAVEPMRARDIHAAVEDRLGYPVSFSSIKNWLATQVRGEHAPLVRLGRGRYQWIADR